MSEFSFSVSRARVERAAGTGLARAAETLATALRARGLRAAPAPIAGGRVRLQIEGAGLVAREFGTLTREAAPVVAPVVRAHAQEIVRLIASEIRSPK